MRGSPTSPGRQTSGAGRGTLSGMTDYEAIGGGQALETIVRDFIGRTSRDMIIGFFFRNADKQRVVAHEIEHASRVLGGPSKYTGRPLVPLHRGLRINRGHFRRRLALLRTVLREQGVDEGVIERWLAHDRQLEGQITDGTDCVE